jgi:hypothetical protein
LRAWLLQSMHGNACTQGQRARNIFDDAKAEELLRKALKVNQVSDS